MKRANEYILDCAQGWIFVRGDAPEVRELARLPRAAIGDGFVAVPAERGTFLAVEALRSPTMASPAYREARARVMGECGLEAGPVALRLKGLKKQLLPHQAGACAFALERRGILNASEQGCIAGDAIMQVKSRSRRVIEMSMREFFHRFTPPGIGPRAGQFQSAWLDSFDERGWDVVTNRVRAIIPKGVKSVCRLETECGKELLLTPDHLILKWVKSKEAIWDPAGNLKRGDIIVVRSTYEPGVKYRPVIACVKNVSPAGETDVYDIVMSDPHRNFAASGVFVHNCGKTLMGWAMAHLWDVRRVLIISPLSVMGVWQREQVEAWGDKARYKVYVLDRGSTKKRAEIIDGIDTSEDVAVVANYEAIGKLAAALERYKAQLVIVDESSRVKNPKAAVTRAVTAICDRASHVLLMNGTPLGNNGVGDLYSQLRMIGPEHVGESYYSFTERYARIRELSIGGRRIRKIVGVRDPLSLMRKLEPVWYRATKETCLVLPPKKYTRVYLDLYPEVERAYKEVKRAGEAALGDALALSSRHVEMIRLHQIAGGHIPRYDSGGSGERKYEMIRARCAKLEWVLQFMREVLVENSAARAIIWVRYRHELERLVLEVGTLFAEGQVVGIDGRTGNALLAELVRSFNSRASDGVRVIVAQVKKLAFGQNLQACDYHIFFSNDWSYITRVQAEDRSHRIGREGAVEYIDLVARGTIDEEILAAFDRFEDLSVRIVRETV